jgi:hypothetical protein
MSVSSVEEIEKANHGRRGVLCAKCEHLNETGVSTCKKCGGHLFVTCVDCGTRNERVLTRCSQCGRRLHRGMFEKHGRSFAKHIRHITPAHIFLYILALGLAFGLVVVFGNMSLSGLW